MIPPLSTKSKATMFSVLLTAAVLVSIVLGALLALGVLAAFICWTAYLFISGFIAGVRHELAVARGWRLISHQGCWSYWANEITGQRQAVEGLDGHGRLDHHWLRDGDVIVNLTGEARRIIKPARAVTS